MRWYGKDGKSKAMAWYGVNTFQPRRQHPLKMKIEFLFADDSATSGTPLRPVL